MHMLGNRILIQMLLHKHKALPTPFSFNLYLQLLMLELPGTVLLGACLGNRLHRTGCLDVFPLPKSQICLRLVFRAFLQLESHFLHVEVCLCHGQRRSLQCMDTVAVLGK